MTITITLTDKQQDAFDKRITGGATAESLAKTIVQEQAQRWYNSDYQALGAETLEKLKSLPQDQLDAIIASLPT